MKIKENEKTSLKEEVLSHSAIFSLLYNASCSTWRPRKDIDKNIIEIGVSELEWTKDSQKFYYFYGFPGPDYNVYTRDNYGIDWAYTEEELVNYWEARLNEEENA